MRYLRVLADGLAILIFVVIGRNTHDHGLSVTGIATTAWPFIVGLLVAWSVMTIGNRSGASFRDGASIAVITVTLGMVLRVLAGQGTALAFIVVALLFLVAFMGGWRLAVIRFQRD